MRGSTSAMHAHAYAADTYEMKRTNSTTEHALSSARAAPIEASRDGSTHRADCATRAPNLGFSADSVDRRRCGRASSALRSLVFVAARRIGTLSLGTAEEREQIVDDRGSGVGAATAARAAAIARRRSGCARSVLT